MNREESNEPVLVDQGNHPVVLDDPQIVVCVAGCDLSVGAEVIHFKYASEVRYHACQFTCGPESELLNGLRADAIARENGILLRCRIEEDERIAVHVEVFG